MEKKQLLANMLNSIESDEKKLSTEQTFGGKFVTGLGLAAKSAGLKVVTTAGNVVDTTYKVGKIAVKSAANATEVINAVVDRADKEVDRLALEGQALGLNRSTEIAANAMTGYEKIKAKFAKKEFDSNIGGGIKNANVETKTV